MIFDICLYKFCSSKLSQYPALEYAKDVISESRKLTFSLHGKRQLSLVKRGVSGKVLLYNIYNYVYNENNDSIGICIVFHDTYPYDIDFLFKFCGLIIADIIEEGKAFHFDSKGNIICDNNGLEFHHSTLSKHKDKIKATLQNVKTKVRAIPRNVYNSFEDQHVICQLSDKSWSLDEIFKTNNVVIITEEIEEENINSMRSFIIKSNETIDNLNRQIKELKKQQRQLGEQKQKEQSNINTSNDHKKQKYLKLSDISNLRKSISLDVSDTINCWDSIIPDIIAGIIVCIPIAIILFNLIIPWFIHSIWVKFTIILTIVGSYFIICSPKFLNLNKRMSWIDFARLLLYAPKVFYKFEKKIFAIFFLRGTVILLSTILNVYGIFGGFASNEVEKQIDSLQWAIDNHNIPTLTRYARLDSTRAYYPLSIELWAQNRDTLNSLINIRKAIKVIDSKDSLYENCLDQLEELKTALDYYNTIAHTAPALPASPEERLTVLSNESSIIKRATVIAEKYSFDYTPNPEILKRIDDDFRRWIYVGDHSVLYTTKKDCYNAALQLKEDPEVKKKLDNLK